MRITKLTTSASTGRLMKRSVKRFHRVSTYVSAGFGFSSGFGARSLLIVTAMPLRNLKTPVLTTVSPAFNPFVTQTKSPRVSPMRTNCCRIVCDSLPVFWIFLFLDHIN